MRFLQRIHPITFLLLASLLFMGGMLRFFPIWEKDQKFETDYDRVYRPVALNVAAGHGLVREEGGSLDTSVTPGYPLLLGLFFALGNTVDFSERTTLTLMALLFALCSIYLVYRIARELLSKWLALLAAGLWVINPFFFGVLQRPSTEIPFIVFFYIAVLQAVMWIKGSAKPWKSGALAGVMIAVAMLIRPFAILLAAPFVVAALLAGGKERLRAGLVFSSALLLALLLAVLPWEIAMRMSSGDWMLLSSGGGNSILDGVSFGLHTKGYRPEKPPLPDDVLDLMQETINRWDSLKDHGTGVMIAFLRDQMRERPLAVIHLFLIKLGRAWYGIDSMTRETYTLLAQLVYLPLTFFGMLVWWRKGGREQRFFAGLALLLTLYFWGMTLLVVPLVRYMMPLFGLYMIFIVVTLLAAAEKLRRLKQSS